MKKTAFLKLALLLPFAFALQGCGTEEVNLNDYLGCTFEGNDTIGNAQYTMDFVRLVEDHYSAFGIKKNHDRSDVDSIAVELSKMLIGTFDEKSNLSNADSITFSWNSDMNVADVEKKYSVSLMYSDQTFTVSGLTELEEINPFDHFRFEINGFGHYVNLMKLSDSNFEYGFDLSYTVNGQLLDGEIGLDLVNGDDVLVKVESMGKNGRDRFATDEEIAKLGYRLSTREKTITIEGMPYYADKASDIPQANLDTLLEAAGSYMKERFPTMVEGEYGEPKIAAIYTLLPKEGMDAGEKNAFVFVFSIPVDDKELYFAGAAKNVMIQADGTCDLAELLDTANVNDEYIKNHTRYLESLERFEEKNLDWQGSKYSNTKYNVEKELM